MSDSHLIASYRRIEKSADNEVSNAIIDIARINKLLAKTTDPMKRSKHLYDLRRAEEAQQHGRSRLEGVRARIAAEEGRKDLCSGASYDQAG